MEPTLRRCRGLYKIAKGKVKDAHPNTISAALRWLKYMEASEEYLEFKQICKEMPEEDLERYRLFNQTDLEEYKFFYERGRNLKFIWNGSVPEKLIYGQATASADLGEGDTE